jgi:hypothetical protein
MLAAPACPQLMIHLSSVCSMCLLWVLLWLHRYWHEHVGGLHRPSSIQVSAGMMMTHVSRQTAGSCSLTPQLTCTSDTACTCSVKCCCGVFALLARAVKAFPMCCITRAKQSVHVCTPCTGNNTCPTLLHSIAGSCTMGSYELLCLRNLFFNA